MGQFNAKRVADAVHGTIGLSDLEVEIISSPIFQRLRNIRQLGLAHYVFPGADYSRFSHSIGVCHVTGRIMEALQNRLGTEQITDKEIVRYRLAALLHDIGHYPYSHAMEDAVDNYIKSDLFYGKDETKNGQPDLEIETIESYKHERLGKDILKHDADLKRILSKEGFVPDDIFSVFSREKTPKLPKLANLVSSDLDADRIDYLLRTAHHTGLPYGSVDLDYLLSQVTIDDQHHVCLHEKAMRTADHFLLCRYFDYQQVAFHKTVAALELVLKDVLALLLDTSIIDCSPETILRLIHSGRWKTFDDSYILSKIHDLIQTIQLPQAALLKARSILERRPPKLIAEKETITERGKRRSVLINVQNVRRLCESYADQSKIDKSLWYVWHKFMPLTKAPSHISVSDLSSYQEKDADEYAQAIRILGKTQKTSQPIFDLPHSLMSVLSDYELASLRVYVLLPEDREDQREKLAASIKADSNYVDWKE